MQKAIIWPHINIYSVYYYAVWHMNFMNVLRQKVIATKNPKTTSLCKQQNE